MKSTEEHFDEWFNSVGESFVKLLQTEVGREEAIIKLQMKSIFIAGAQVGLEQGRKIFIAALIKS